MQQGRQLWDRLGLNPQGLWDRVVMLLNTFVMQHAQDLRLIGHSQPLNTIDLRNT